MRRIANKRQTADEINRLEFERAVKLVKCEYILERYARCSPFPDAKDLLWLDEMARKGDCQFSRKCRHCQPECNCNEPPPRITFGIPKIPLGKRYRTDDE